MDNRLLDLVERITEWRDARPPNCKGRIPAEIWSEAVELAHSEGIAPISKALCLEFRHDRELFREIAQRCRCIAEFIEEPACVPRGVLADVLADIAQVLTGKMGPNYRISSSH